MTTKPHLADPIDAVALLAEPNRRALYALVVESRGPVGRDDAVEALGISRELAAFHPSTDWSRRACSRPSTAAVAGGPGPAPAARPSCIDEPRASSRSRSRLASTTSRRRSWRRRSIASAAHRGPRPWPPARERGTAVGLEARRRAGTRPGRRRSVTGLLDVLRGAGFEPQAEPDGRVYLRNCPYDALVADHRDLTCGMNLAWAEGVVDGLGDSKVTVDLAPDQGRCCVVFQSGPDPAHRTAGESEAR